MSGSGSEQSSKSGMPKFVKEEGKFLAGMAHDAIGNYDPQFYQGQQYANQSPYSQNAINQMGNFSSQPSQDYMSSVMGGDYLGLNPSMQNAVMNPAMSAVNDQFNSAGRYGSAMNQQQAGQAGMSALMPYYDAERQRQQQAAQLLPGMQQNDIGMQAKGGIGQEHYGQQPIDQAMAAHQFQQDQPLMQTQAMAQMLMPLFGLSPNTESSQSQGWADQVSGLLSGAGSMLGGAAKYKGA